MRPASAGLVAGPEPLEGAMMGAVSGEPPREVRVGLVELGACGPPAALARAEIGDSAEAFAYRHRPTRRGLALISALVLVVLVGCSGEPKPPTNVGTTSATLKANARVDNGDNPVSWWWQIAPTQSALGPPNPSGATTRCLAGPANVPAGTYNGLGCKVTDLTPNTTYFYRFCGDTAKLPPTCIPTIQQFATAPDCDDTKTSSESVAEFIEDNQPGTPSNRQVLCLPGGSHQIGQLDSLKDYQTLTAAPTSDGSGRRQTVELHGNIGIDSVGVTLSDLRLVGCFNSSENPNPGCGAGRNKVIDVKGDDAVLRHLDITAERQSEAIDGVLVGSGDIETTGARFLENKIHSLGYDKFDHPIYFSQATSSELAGNWHWDIPGFIVFQMNGDNDSNDVHQLIADDSVRRLGSCCGGGITFYAEADQADGPEHNAVHDLVVTDAGSNTLYCANAGANATNSVDNLVASPFEDGCDAFDVTNLHELRPTYKDEPNRDYRIPDTGSAANDAARAALGDYAERIPGPRTSFYTIPAG